MGEAIISDCGAYRYRLERDFYRPGPVAAVFMVNPSTADASQDDATIRRLLGFGSRLGWHSVIVGNVFAYRATDVKRLDWEAYDPVGPDNERHIRDIMRAADVHIAAWGPLSKLPNRLRLRWQMIERCARDEGYDLKCWGTAKDGHPRHPLMLSYDTPLTAWSAPIPPRKDREMSEWQPIKSAPRDDGEIIMVWNGKEVTPASRYESGWTDFYCDWIDPQPTHWQSLPPPPLNPMEAER